MLQLVYHVMDYFTDVKEEESSLHIYVQPTFTLQQDDINMTFLYLFIFSSFHLVSCLFQVFF